MKNMTTGKPVSLIIGFAVPLLIGNVFQQVYNFVDVIIVGRYLGEQALAGVGSTSNLTLFLLSLISGLCGTVFWCGRLSKNEEGCDRSNLGCRYSDCIGGHDRSQLQSVFSEAAQSAGGCHWIFCGILTYFVHFCSGQCSV